MALKRGKNGRNGNGGGKRIHEEILETSHKVLERTWLDFFGEIGRNTLTLFEYLGGLWKLAVHTLYCLFRYPFPFRAFVEQCEFVGVKSLSLIALISVFTGMVFSLQFAVGLGRFGLKIYIGNIIGLAIMRELGPVLVCLMLAARVGSGIAAELGSMVVTEQVLAIEALGANPVHKLVLPRVLALTISAPVLATIGSIIGVIGGMFITIMEAGVTARFYFDQIRRTVEMEDYFSGMAKTLFFGFFIGLIACYQGLKTSGGTEGVGKSTTYAVVITSLMVFVADFFLTKLLLLL
ncbi:MAG TPA: ABC transporter permease [bacterium]|nr:ABC transporter permease [bacterium]